MRELARLPGFLLAELLGRLVANALVALLGWASDQLMHHVRYASPAVDTENLRRGTYGVSTATQRWFVSLTAAFFPAKARALQPVHRAAERFSMRSASDAEWLSASIAACSRPMRTFPVFLLAERQPHRNAARPLNNHEPAQKALTLPTQ